MLFRNASNLGMDQLMKTRELMEKKVKHLELIQSVIERMGNNSFLIKGWSITLVSAIFVVTIQETNHRIARKT